MTNTQKQTKKAQINEVSTIELDFKKMEKMWILATFEKLKDKKQQDNKIIFALQNYLKEQLIILYGRTQKNELSIEFGNIGLALLFDTQKYLLENSLNIISTIDLKNHKINFKNLKGINDTLTLKQKKYYNFNFDTNYTWSKKEEQEEQEKQNTEQQILYDEIYSSYGIGIEL